MQYRELHPWHVSVTEAQRIQQRLRRHIEVDTAVREMRYIAGADIAVAHTTPTVYAGVVVLDYTTLAVVECKDPSINKLPTLMQGLSLSPILRA